MTPPSVADAMVAEIKRSPESIFVLDPACGDGNLLLAVARLLSSAGVKNIHERIVGIDIDSAMIARARNRLSEQLRCEPDDLRLWTSDFMNVAQPNLLEALPIKLSDVNVVLSNPPYGKLREYRFFESACKHFKDDTELVFLVPLSFLDRVEGVTSKALDGRPLGVTTGHAIVHHCAGEPFSIRSVRAFRANRTNFRILSGVKLYEVGAGTPAQSRSITKEKPFSSNHPRTGWLPCVRTGDVHAFRVSLDRLWVDYGVHLAHPKDISRFTGPRLFVRRMPIWGTRQLGAAYLSEPALCAGDMLVVQHKDNDIELLHGLCVFLNSQEAADFVLASRPSVQLRDSYPKISGKDLNRLLDARIPDDGSLIALARQYDHIVSRGAALSHSVTGASESA